MSLQTVRIFSYNVASITLEQAADWCLKASQGKKPKLLVTLNPEIIVQAHNHAELKSALEQADLSVADGVGVIWASQHVGHKLPERVAGVELVTELLRRGGAKLRVFFLGAKPGIAEKAASEAQKRFGIEIAGSYHGYFDREKDAAQICQMVKASAAQVLLAGLGEGQELFLHKNRAALDTALMIGVGGTLDVLSGTVERSPRWTHKLGLEWAYRVGLDPKRWHRFPRLLRFIYLVYSSS